MGIADQTPLDRGALAAALRSVGQLTNPFYCGFSGIIDDSATARFSNAIGHAISKKFDSIYIAFNSSGGIVADGVYIYNQLRAAPIPTFINATGSVQSIAMAVYVGGSTRLCSKHATFMAHPTTMPSFDQGWTWDRLKSSMDAAIAEDNRIENILRERCTIDEGTLKGRRYGDLHFSAKDAVELGIADRIEEFKLPMGKDFMQL